MYNSQTLQQPLITRYIYLNLRTPEFCKIKLRQKRNLNNILYLMYPSFPPLKGLEKEVPLPKRRYLFFSFLNNTLHLMYLSL
ncbi:unnamed protein product [Meloidogyne enterolobii]|uniref:Uncharacterized protein n=1 Tax=Meloidogyne enterolobii TaxID=390850 RepID=A0ACB0Y811_MELEN